MIPPTASMSAAAVRRKVWVVNSPTSIPASLRASLLSSTNVQSNRSTLLTLCGRPVFVAKRYPSLSRPDSASCCRIAAAAKLGSAMRRFCRVRFGAGLRRRPSAHDLQLLSPRTLEEWLTSSRSKLDPVKVGWEQPTGCTKRSGDAGHRGWCVGLVVLQTRFAPR